MTFNEQRGPQGAIRGGDRGLPGALVALVWAPLMFSPGLALAGPLCASGGGWVPEGLQEVSAEVGGMIALAEPRGLWVRYQGAWGEVVAPCAPLRVGQEGEIVCEVRVPCEGAPGRARVGMLSSLGAGYEALMELETGGSLRMLALSGALGAPTWLYAGEVDGLSDEATGEAEPRTRRREAARGDGVVMAEELGGYVGHYSVPEDGAL